MTETTTEAIAHSTTPANLVQEMRRSYLDYAMSVIVGRALPDVHDGLKPVHRRVLYAMYELGNEWNKPYKKSARIVGDVIGKYHPHGDTAVYDAIVRMAQDFSMRYPLIDGQGNFGSVDGDAPAAMRYTEIRLQRIAHELLSDIDRETVDFGPNYDDTETQPLVLPSRVPNLLINGSTGIAVGMATNIPPHNLAETIDACFAYIDNSDIELSELMKIIPGPDFPVAGIINGAHGIEEAYATGRGKIYVRGRVAVEESGGRQAIIVTELPYQVNKARLLEKIAELVKVRRLEGITSLRDESDKSGMRMVIELKRGEVPEVVINNLYRLTHLETVFSINMVALVNNQPRVFTLKGIIGEFVRHRREVVTRRTVFDLRKTRERAHVLEGYAVALTNIDPIIALIKASKSSPEARAALMAKPWPKGAVGPLLERLRELLEGPAADFLPPVAQLPAGAGAAPAGPDGTPSGLGDDGYRLSETQAQAILELRLNRLTGLEQDKIYGEYNEALDRITDLSDILARRARLMEVVRAELEESRERYGDKRRTEIWRQRSGIQTEDLIAEEDVVVTLTHAGYAKAQPLATYRSQRRGGRGRTATRTREEDFINRLFLANTHDTVLCFSNHGLVYWLKVYELPQAGPQARGKPLVNLLPLRENEQVTTLLPVRSYDEDRFVTMATSGGYLKRCPLSAFARPRSTGLRALGLVPGDQLISVAVTDGYGEIMLFSDAGKAVRFAEDKVRVMGRPARGVRGMKLGKGDRIISMITVPADTADAGTVLTATTHGYGKRTTLEQYPVKSRGVKGVISIRTNERNGPVVGAELVQDDDGVMLITGSGTLIRTAVGQIPVTGRSTQGVRLIRLRDGEVLRGMSKVDVPDEDEDEEANGGNGGNGSDGEERAPAATNGADDSGDMLARDNGDAPPPGNGEDAG